MPESNKPSTMARPPRMQHNFRRVAILFAAVGSAATVLTAAMPWLQPDTLSRRIKAVSSERERIRARERERQSIGYIFPGLQ